MKTKRSTKRNLPIAGIVWTIIFVLFMGTFIHQEYFTIMRLFNYTNEKSVFTLEEVYGIDCDFIYYSKAAGGGGENLEHQYGIKNNIKSSFDEHVRHLLFVKNGRVVLSIQFQAGWVQIQADEYIEPGTLFMVSPSANPLSDQIFLVPINP